MGYGRGRGAGRSLEARPRGPVRLTPGSDPACADRSHQRRTNKENYPGGKRQAGAKASAQIQLLQVGDNPRRGWAASGKRLQAIHADRTYLPACAEARDSGSRLNLLSPSAAKAAGAQDIQSISTLPNPASPRRAVLPKLVNRTASCHGQDAPPPRGRLAAVYRLALK